MKPLAKYLPTLSFVCLFGCQPDFTEPGISLDEFTLADGFEVECVAAEPFVQSPVALAFDGKNRMWVVEMAGYMNNLDGTGEDAPNGKIIILEDRDEDGKVDHRKVFLDGLVLPRAIALVYGGVLYAEPPNLWFVEIKHDRPGEQILVDSTYADGGNVEHQPNGLLLNIDNWIYNAKSDKRYRFRNGKWEIERTAFRGQWGITNDEAGRLFYNDNSNQLMGDFLLPNVLERNGALAPKFGLGQQICTDQRVYPLHATSVNRGYQTGILDEKGRLKNFTSACGPVIYSGDQFPKEYYGNAFVCAPEANLVKRNIVYEDGNGRLGARQAWHDREFLASNDETFRPVNLYNGPDGGLYIVDMRHGIIQHKTYMTNYLRLQLKGKGLDTVVSKGRIYRVRKKEGGMTPQPAFSTWEKNKTKGLLSHPNGFVRSRAQQSLVESKRTGIAPDLKRWIADSPSRPIAAIHALWALEGLDMLDEATVLLALQHPDSKVVATGIRLSQLMKLTNPKLFIGQFRALARRNNALIDLYICAALGGFYGNKEDEVFPSLAALLKKHEADTLFSEAAISGLSEIEPGFLGFLEASKVVSLDHPIFAMLKSAIKKRQELKEKPLSRAAYSDDNTRGFKLFKEHCSGCHLPSGEGLPGIAPPLLGAGSVNHSKEKIEGIVRNGLSTPVKVDGKSVRFNNAMPAFKDYQGWTDGDFKAVAAYVRNAFAGSLD